MKAFMDRHYFRYQKDQKYKARAVGVIVVADCEGIEDTVATLMKFINCSFVTTPEPPLTVTGYACQPGEAAQNAALMAAAHGMSEEIARRLKGSA
jgi:multimeric flavodoxin WrbA